jgi:pilus assembly protein Flp/PilA
MKISFLRRFARNDSGATALEYGLLAGLISIMVIGGATLAGTSIDTIFDQVAAKLQTAATNASSAGAAASGGGGGGDDTTN